MTTEAEEFEFRHRLEQEKAAASPKATVKNADTALLPQVAEEEPHPNLVQIGSRMAAPFEKAGQLIDSARGKDKEAIAGAQSRGQAMEALGEAHPLSRITGAGADVAMGAALPAFKGASALGKVGAGVGTGAVQGASQPVTEGSSVTGETAKQAGKGGILGGGLQTLFNMVPKSLTTPIMKVIEGFGKERPMPVIPQRAPVGHGAQEVAAHLQKIRDTIEAKVSGKGAAAEEEGRRIMQEAEAEAQKFTKGAEINTARTMQEAQQKAEELMARANRIGTTRVASEQAKVEAATDAPKALETATPSELGQTVRGTISGRKEGVEDSIKKATEPARQAAYKESADLRPVLDTVAKLKNAVSDPTAMKEVESLLKTATKNSGAAREVVQTKIGPMEVKDGKLVPATQSNGANMEIVHDARQRIQDLIDKHPNDRKALMQVVNAIDAAAPKSFRDYLALERSERQKLDPFSSTSGPGARTAGVLQKDQFGKDFMSNPESVGGKFFKPGDEGTAAAREFKTAVGNDPEAMRSMSNYISGKLKNLDPSKWGTFLSKHEGALKELGLFDKLQAFERESLKAGHGLAAANTTSKALESFAKAEGKSVVSEAERSSKDFSERNRVRARDAESTGAQNAKSVVGAAKQTEKNVSDVLKQGAIGDMTGASPGFQKYTGRDAQNAIEKVFKSDRPDLHFKQLVSATKNDPAAIDGLRKGFGEWLYPKDGKPLTAPAMAERWNSVKSSVEKSGMFSPEHYKFIDNMVANIEAQETGKKIAGGAGALGGLALGLLKVPFGGHMLATSHWGREAAEKMVSGEQNRMSEALKLVMDEPTSLILQKPATPENLSLLGAAMKRLDLDPSFQKTLLNELSKKSGEEKVPPRRAPRPDPLSMRPSGI